MDAEAIYGRCARPAKTQLYTKHSGVKVCDLQSSKLHALYLVKQILLLLASLSYFAGYGLQIFFQQV